MLITWRTDGASSHHSLLEEVLLGAAQIHYSEEPQHSPWAPGALCRHSSAPALQSALHSAEQRSWDSLQICAGEAAVSERSQSDSSWLVLFFLSAFV